MRTPLSNLSFYYSPLNARLCTTCQDNLFNRKSQTFSLAFQIATASFFFCQIAKWFFDFHQFINFVPIGMRSHKYSTIRFLHSYTPLWNILSNWTRVGFVPLYSIFTSIQFPSGINPIHLEPKWIFWAIHLGISFACNTGSFLLFSLQHQISFLEVNSFVPCRYWKNLLNFFPSSM